MTRSSTAHRQADFFGGTLRSTPEQHDLNIVNLLIAFQGATRSSWLCDGQSPLAELQHISARTWFFSGFVPRPATFSAPLKKNGELSCLCLKALVYPQKGCEEVLTVLRFFVEVESSRSRNKAEDFGPRLARSRIWNRSTKCQHKVSLQ